MQLSWNRILSGLIALGYIIAAAVFVGAEGGFRAFVTVLFPLVCIWFGNAMGGYTGPAGTIGITTPSPGFFVCALGWILLVIPIVLVLLN